MTTTSTPTASNTSAAPIVTYGPAAWLTGSAIALTVTAAAATVAPDLAHHHHGLYVVSGVAMTAADAFVLLGVVALARCGALPATWYRTVSFALAIAGSAGVVLAEALLRVDDTVGNTLFSVVGPIQALGFIGAGAALARRSDWRGWRRAPLLTLGLYIPLVLVPLVVVPSQASGAEENLLPLAGYHLLIGLVGLAFAAEQRRRR